MHWQSLSLTCQRLNVCAAPAHHGKASGRRGTRTERHSKFAILSFSNVKITASKGMTALCSECPLLIWQRSDTWQDIANAMYPGTSQGQLSLAFRWRTRSHWEAGPGMSEIAADTASNRRSNARGRTGRRPFRIPLVDFAAICRLRETKTSWAVIAPLMCPKANRESLRKAYIA